MNFIIQKIYLKAKLLIKLFQIGRIIIGHSNYTSKLIVKRNIIKKELCQSSIKLLPQPNIIERIVVNKIHIFNEDFTYIIPKINKNTTIDPTYVGEVPG